MITPTDTKNLCRDLPPPEVDRAIKFNEISRDEAIVLYKMLLSQKKAPRQILLRGYDAMYAAASLFFGKKFNKLG